MLIAIDGPAGAGKSTVARGVAGALGFTYLDTGAMYRCVALLCLEAPDRPPATLARGAQIEFRSDQPGGTQPGAPASARVWLGDRDVSEAIRSPEVSRAASEVAVHPAVREAMVAAQRALIAAGGDWVAEGRDIGTVVAPDAELKIFLTASAAERARRRAAELGANPRTVLAEQTLRDGRDSAREHSPLAPAADAVTLDTTGLGLDQVIQKIVALARPVA
jgi:cytidylate kinase